MSTEDMVVAETPSYLGMSDADVLKAGPPVVGTEENKDEKPVVADPVVDSTADTAHEDADDGLDTGGDSQPGEKPAVVDESDSTSPKTDKIDVVDDAVDKDIQKDPKKDVPVVDFEAEYKRLLAPFKANGRDIQVESVDDAITLMQMGANYNKKMAALKPNLKLMKMLENNNLMSEEKISFLIDLGKRDPAAINKLVKDSGIDPMDLSAEKASAYKHTAYAVDDREIDLDTILDELQGTPSYTRTLDVVSNKWDVASKQIVSQTPQLLKVLNDHVASGIYDLISKEVERERLFGRLTGASDIAAYRQIGDAIQARGGFDHLFQKQADTKPKQGEVVPPKPKQAEDDALKDKRRAASSTRPVAPSTGVPKDFNPLSMSDEEFSKLATPKFH